MASGWHDLSHPFFEGMNRAGIFPAPSIRTLKNVETDPLNVMEYTFVTHLGTHVDAPRHFVRGGQTIDQLPLDRFMGQGVVLDLRTSRPEGIGAEDLAKADPEVRRGDIVLIYTGWAERFGTPDYDLHPYLREDAARWILDRGAKLVGLDLTTPEAPPPLRPAGFNWPVHHLLLEAGVLVAENVASMVALVGRRVEVMAAPIVIRDGDGGPARILARLV